MKRLDLLPIATAALVLAACQSQSAMTGPKLSAAQVKAAMSGSTVHARSIDYDYVAYFAADGTAKFRSGATTNPGTWKVTDDGQLCTSFSLGGPDQGCMTVAAKDGVYTFTKPNGVVFATATLTPGNGEGL